mgnify:CR=1 FL=1
MTITSFIGKYGVYNHKFWLEGTGLERFLNAEMIYPDGRVLWAQYNQRTKESRLQVKKFEKTKAQHVVDKLEGEWSEWSEKI